MAGTGGARPGAGRKRKAVKHVTAINQAEAQIKDRLPDIVDALMASAVGLWVEQKDSLGNVLENPDGTTKVYRTNPDVKAGMYLVDRILGKPTERTEDLTKDKQLKILIEYADSETDPS